MNGVILYGAPATGKDTVTTALARQYPHFVPYKRLKCGPGRTAGYRTISPEAMAAIPASSILWTNHRYGATYLVDRDELVRILDTGCVPVLHLGQPEAVEALVDQTPRVSWLVVELHSPLRVLRERIRERGTGDDEQRLEAAMHTPPLLTARVRVDTSAIEPASAARIIAEHVPGFQTGQPQSTCRIDRRGG